MEIRNTAVLPSIVLGLMIWGFASTVAAAEPVLDLKALSGQVVYLDFWASWCAPCRQSFPWMDRMQRELGRDGFVVVAVNVDRVRAEADQFLQKHPVGFRIAFDPEGALAERFGVKGMPTSYLIDRSGQIHSEVKGFRLQDRNALEQRIRSLLATPPATNPGS